MAGHENSGKKNTQLLEELEALSSSLYQSHTAAATRRTASLALPRNTPIPTVNNDSAAAAAKPRSGSQHRRRLSLSPWRSRPNNDDEEGGEPESNRRRERSKHVSSNPPEDRQSEKETGGGGGLWKNWKPIRALSHIGMQKLSCLFSVEVVTVQNLPASMNGLRLSVCVRKKETRDGAVQTMPSRVSQGAADFEETLFLRCHVYCSEQSDPARRGGKSLKFESRPFWIYAFAVDAGELDFGRSSVDLSELIRESVEKSHEGARVRTWDVTFGLAGKAKGGDLVVKLGFQIMEKDGGIGIYNYSTVSPSSSSPSSSSNAISKPSKGGFLSPSFARKQSKTSFSVPSPKLSSKKDHSWTPLQSGISSGDEIDDLNLDEPAQAAQPKPPPEEATAAEPELDLPDFEVVDKGVEFQEINDKNNIVENDNKEEEEEGEEEEEEEEENDKSSVKSVVKEIDHVHVARLTELDSIAQQIKALESIMGDESSDVAAGKKISRETKHKSQRLDADEETVTREFLQMLEEDDDGEAINIDDYKLDGDGSNINIPAMSLGGSAAEPDNDKTYISDLGKNLGCVVQTRDGGYLAAMNPLDGETTRKETPKLAMQISKPFVVAAAAASSSGFELLQSMAGLGAEELGSELGRVLIEPMDELTGKTAEQVAFEGIAGAVIHGRNRSEVASSSAGRAIAAAKAAAAAMSSGRRERVATGIWNLSEDPVGPEEVVAFSMQKIEAMAVEGLKIQADMADEEPPFDVPPPPASGRKSGHPLSKAVPLEEWLDKNNGGRDVKSLALAVGIQLRDPVRRYETVGGPMIGIIYAEEVGGCDDEKRFKVTSVHVAGVRLNSNSKKVKSSNNSNKQRLTAMQWLVGYGFGSGNDKIKATKNLQSSSVKGQDVLWSLSSRVMADMWLKSMRNPDVKFTN